MKNGWIKGSSRGAVKWLSADEDADFFDTLFAGGEITNVKYSLLMTSFKLKASYCDKCKKIIIDTEVIE